MDIRIISMKTKILTQLNMELLPRKISCYHDYFILENLYFIQINLLFIPYKRASAEKNHRFCTTSNRLTFFTITIVLWLTKYLNKIYKFTLQNEHGQRSLNHVLNINYSSLDGYHFFRSLHVQISLNLKIYSMISKISTCVHLSIT